MIISFAGFPGGMDVRSSPEAISESCLATAQGCQFVQGSAVLRKADGIDIVFDAETAVESGFEFNGKQLFNSSQNLYSSTLSAKSLLGTLDGTDDAAYFAWADECLICSGGKLQRLTGAWALSTVAGSPDCNGGMIREARILVWKRGDDFLYFSAIGDPTTWDLSPVPKKDWTGVTPATEATTALYIEIGYQDGRDIVDVATVGPDLIIHKARAGNIDPKSYRLIGAFPNWEVREVTSVPVVHSCSALNDNFVIGRSGFKNLTPVIQYGDINQGEAGDKVNSAITKQTIDANARIWFAPSKKIFYVKASDDKKLWMFHYNNKDPKTGEQGAWTFRYLQDNIRHIWESNGIVYAAIGNYICKFNDETATDITNDFSMLIRSKKFNSSKNFLITKATLFYESKVAGAGTLTIGNFTAALTFPASDDITILDTDITIQDTDPIVGSQYQSNVFRFVSFSKTFYVELTCHTGSIGFRGLELEVEEVDA